jgi:hypothetical protein
MNNPGIYTEELYYGIFDTKENLTKFELISQTDNEDFFDFEMGMVYGHSNLVLNNLEVIHEIAIDMTLFARDRKFIDFMNQEEYSIKKLTKEEYETFLPKI